MEARKCPNCQYQHTLKEHYKNVLFSSYGHKWKCPNCNKELKVNYNRQFSLFLVGIAPLILLQLFDLSKGFQLSSNIHLNTGLVLSGVLLVVFFWSVITFYFQNYQLIKSRR